MKSILHLLSLGWVANAAVALSQGNKTPEIHTRDTAGYRSVAYYVNWVSHPSRFAPGKAWLTGM